MGRCLSASVPHAPSTFHYPPYPPHSPCPSPSPAGARPCRPSSLSGLSSSPARDSGCAPHTKHSTRTPPPQPSSPGRNSGCAPHTKHSTSTPPPQPASRHPPRTGLGFGEHCRSRFVLPSLPSAQPLFSSPQYHLPQSSLSSPDLRLSTVPLPQSPLFLRDFSCCVLPYRALSTPLPTLRLSFSSNLVLPASSHVSLPSAFAPGQSSVSNH